MCARWSTRPPPLATGTGDEPAVPPRLRPPAGERLSARDTAVHTARHASTEITGSIRLILLRAGCLWNTSRPRAERVWNRRGSDRGSEGIFDGLPAPPSHQARLAVPENDRLLVLVVAVAPCAGEGGTKNHHKGWWLFTSLILRVWYPPELAPSASRRLPGF